MAKRHHIAGVITNTQENMVRRIMHRSAVHPPTTMPNLDVSEAHARVIVAYLATFH